MPRQSSKGRLRGIGSQGGESRDHNGVPPSPADDARVALVVVHSHVQLAVPRTGARYGRRPASARTAAGRHLYHRRGRRHAQSALDASEIPLGRGTSYPSASSAETTEVRCPTNPERRVEGTAASHETQAGQGPATGAPQSRRCARPRSLPIPAPLPGRRPRAPAGRRRRGRRLARIDTRAVRDRVGGRDAAGPFCSPGAR